MNVIVSRTGGTPEACVNQINYMLGKEIESPRDDYPGIVEVRDVLSIQITRTAPDWYYAVSVVKVEPRKEALDVEKEFFSAAQKTG
jgi:hypothetical protein